MTRRAPERLSWAVDLLGLRPGESVLEIGQGTGVSTGLVLERLDGGRYVGLDRSARATATAADRFAAAVTAGRAAFLHGDVDEVNLSAAAFDAVLAVNVNRFWTSEPSGVLERLRGWLRPGGRIALVWEPPGQARADEIAERLGPAVGAAGFDVRVERATATTGAPLVAVLGRIG